MTRRGREVADWKEKETDAKRDRKSEDSHVKIGPMSLE